MFDICCTIFFFIATIALVVKNSKQSSPWLQVIAVNSFVAGTRALKDVLPFEYYNIVKLFRIVIGVGLLILFYFQNTKEKSEEV